MSVLVLADINGTRNAITAAKQLGDIVDVLVVGSDASQIVKIDGVRQVITVDIDHPLAEDITNTILSVASDYDVIVATTSNIGKSVIPRVAAKLDVQPISGVIELVDKDTFRRSIYSGNFIATVKSSDSKKVMTIQPTSFEQAGIDNNAPIITKDAPKKTDKVRYIGTETIKSDRPELTTAKCVIAGGVSLGSKEAFEELLFPLADKLNAAVGATRNAVDAGYAPVDAMIGQTGKVIAPELYIGAGVKGTIQHVVGMRQSKTIVAINTDEKAEIFDVADYGLVGDMFDLLPELKDKI